MLTELDLWISEQLIPIREALVAEGIPVAMLPLQAASYSRDSSEGEISIAIPQVVGQDPGNRGVGQVLTYSIAVALRLPNRYDNTPGQISALETVAGAIASSLVKKAPLTGVLVPIYLSTYDLLQPSGKQWLASMVFKFQRSTTALLENDELDTDKTARLVAKFLVGKEEEAKEIWRLPEPQGS